MTLRRASAWMRRPRGTKIKARSYVCEGPRREQPVPSTQLASQANFEIHMIELITWVPLRREGIMHGANAILPKEYQ